MRFLLKLSILCLAFQAAFGMIYYQRQQQKKKQAAQIAVVKAKADIILRNACNVVENYNAGICVRLRATDAAAEEARRIVAEKKAQRKAYCATNTYDAKCMTEFGIPEPWNIILNITLCIPVLLIVILLY